MPTPISFKTKLLIKPCKRLLGLLKFPYKRAFKLRNPRKVRSKKRRRFRQQLVSFFWRFKRPRRSEERMDRVMELKSFNERDQLAAPFPSPLTPAFIKLMAGARYGSDGGGGGGGGGGVEEACRSFENYLVEMIVEEGKVKDLTDVEELLYCWNSLKSPVFADLVSRFYGELCKDLFSGGGMSNHDQYQVLDDDDDDDSIMCE